MGRVDKSCPFIIIRYHSYAVEMSVIWKSFLANNQDAQYGKNRWREICQE